MTPAPLGVAILAATFAFAQAHSGLEVVVKVEARRLAGEPASELVSRALANGFPEGAVTETYLTDGRAVSSTASKSAQQMSRATPVCTPSTKGMAQALRQMLTMSAPE